MNETSASSPSTVGGLRVPGQRYFDRFTLVGRATFPGITEDWTARDTDGATVLLRFLPLAAADVARVEATFVAAADPYLGWEDPGLVRLVELVGDETGLAFVSERIEGTSLVEQAGERPGGVFELEEVRDLCVKLCDILERLHRAGLVHGDLQPGQLLVVAGQLKVAGYGVSTILSSVDVHWVANTGALTYLSPQQLEGNRPTPADDVYALGVLLHTMLAGRPPFDEGDVGAQVRMKEAPSVAEHRKALGGRATQAVPPSWEMLIASCLAKDPALRPTSVWEVAMKIAGATLAKAAEKNVSARMLSAARNPLLQLVAVGLLLVGMVVYHFAFRVRAEWKDREVARLKVVRRLEEEKRLGQTGRLRIRTTPNFATVFVDGDRVGPHPISLKTSPGVHQLRVIKDGYEEWVGEVTVVANGSVEQVVVLTHEVGTVRIHGTVGAEVFDGDKSLGKLPLVLEGVGVGRVSYVVRADGFVPLVLDALVESKSMVLLQADLKPWKGPNPGTNIHLPDLGIDLVWVAPGSIAVERRVSGSRDKVEKGEWVAAEGYWIAKTEVTQRQWNALMDRDWSVFKGDDLPVQNVSWYDAMTFCARLTKREAERLPQGYVYSLPESVQWELALLAGRRPEVELVGDLADWGWCRENSGRGPQRVATKRANPWGLCDMIGNVVEWTDYDGMDSLHHSEAKGGGWSEPAKFGEQEMRRFMFPKLARLSQLGFRVALRPEASTTRYVQKPNN